MEGKDDEEIEAILGPKKKRKKPTKKSSNETDNEAVPRDKTKDLRFSQTTTKR